MKTLLLSSLAVLAIALAGPVAAAETTVAPVVVKEVRPAYPRDMMREGIRGSVRLAIEVKADGTVGRVNVTKGLHPRFDKAAMDAARRWQFKPGTKNGKPVGVTTELEMTFDVR
jgi:protein TonB